MSGRTTTTPTGGPKQPDCLPIQEMVSPPQSQIAKEFRGAADQAHAPTCTPNPQDSGWRRLRTDLTPYSIGRHPRIVKTAYGSEVKLVELIDAFGTTEAKERL